MRIAMLGPLVVTDAGGAEVNLPGARLRALLVGLALEPGRAVPTSRLIDAVWGDSPPAGAVNALQSLVSRLRRALPEAVIAQGPAGYRLAIEPEEVDATRFQRLVSAGRSADDPAVTARILREALALWRGPALADVADAGRFQPVVARLSELRLAALEALAEAELRRGRGAGLAGELAAVVAEHPLRERLAGALMRALCAAGRPAEALTVYERARGALAEALGADPSPELSALHTAILRGEYGPPRPEPRRTNLRAGLTSFVGRDEAVAAVGKLLGEHRLATLTGPGGSGKTRLAIEAARTQLDQMPQGVWLVELAPVTDPAGLPPAVLAALGVREQVLAGRAPAGEPLERLVAALRGWHALLVLDNCEHLIDAAAALVDQLLGDCPWVRILATSREPLGITGEALWPVEPLGLPPAQMPPETVDVTVARAYPAVRLLEDRAAAARPGFVITADTAPAVVRICRALDGMPLAIELAAARLRTMRPDRLADQVGDRFRLLTGGSRTALPRHRTLRAVVDWSWELLSGPERALLRRLAGFTGGATVAAAERVCAGGPVPAARTLELLSALVDKSLLLVDPDADPPRYRMLETIKAYGLDQLAVAGEQERIRRAHADYVTELAEAADPHLRRAKQLEWLRRLGADHDNITAALRGAIAAGDARRAVRLAVATGWYWWLTGRKAEGAQLTTAALAVPGPVAGTVRAAAYALSALFATAGVGDWRQAESWLDQAQLPADPGSYRSPVLRLAGPMRELLRGLREDGTMSMDPLARLFDDDDPWVRAVARMNRADVWRSCGQRHAEAEADVRQALAEFRAIGERWGISFALASLADLLAERGDLPAALAYSDQAIAAATELGAAEDMIWMRTRQAQLRWLTGDPAGSAAAIAEAERDAERMTWPDAVAGLAHGKAELARWAGDLDTARAELARAEAALRHVTIDPVFRAMLLHSHAFVDALAGDLGAASARRSEALRLALAATDVPVAGQVLLGVADQAVRQGQPVVAATLLAASAAIRGLPDQCHPDALGVASAVRAALGEPELAEATRTGQRLTMPQISESAAAVLDLPG